MIELLPTFLGLAARESEHVFVIDEVDRILHTLLVRSLAESYLSVCSTTSRSQVLFTTHDVQLMDQQLLRRDEMWATERAETGTSILFPFRDYKDIRYDKDIRKSYLQGRLGGMPHIFREALFATLVWTRTMQGLVDAQEKAQVHKRFCWLHLPSVVRACSRGYWYLFNLIYGDRGCEA